MRNSFVRAGNLAAVAVLALAGCRGGPNPEDALGIAAAQQRAAAQATGTNPVPAQAAQLSLARLVRFDLFTADGTEVGHFQKISDDTWILVHSDGIGIDRMWHQQSVNASSLVLYTDETPIFQTLTIHADHSVSSPDLPSGGRITHEAYQ